MTTQECAATRLQQLSLKKMNWPVADGTDVVFTCYMSLQSIQSFNTYLSFASDITGHRYWIHLAPRFINYFCSARLTSDDC